MDGREFLEVAKSLINGNKEAEYRSAVSRAYYGAYNFAVQLLESWGFHVEKGTGGHGKTRYRFSQCGVSDLKDAASKLADLHSRRIDADYLKKENVGKQKTASLYVNLGEEIVKTFELCIHDPTKTKVIEGIREYDSSLIGDK